MSNIFSIKNSNLLGQLLLACVFMLCINACTLQNREYDYTPISGGKYYGGVYRWNETEYIRSLFPHNITEVTGHRTSNQIYEGLVRLDQSNLSIQPALATSWSIDTSATIYTFTLRKNVWFHNDSCFGKEQTRLLNINDIKYCFDLLCTVSDMNKGFWIFENRVKGANEYHELSKERKPLPKEGVSGIKILNDSTIQIELLQPFSAFLHVLATPFAYIFPKEAYEKYGKDLRIKTVGTGPFLLKTIEEDEALILSKNQKYWGKDSLGNALPYLDGIKISFIKESQAEFLEFKRGNLDQVYRPALEMLDEILDEKGELTQTYKYFQHQKHSTLSLQYYGFLNTSTLFSNQDLRKAFCYAIDRDKICKYTLKGTGIPASYGVVPPGMSGYNSEKINGYTFDINKAKSYLEKAGYPNGNGLAPLTLQINAGGGRNQQVAEAITKMLRDNLNIDINITQVQWAQHLENAETSKVLFWRFGWVADYPDPENFLNLFYSPHVPEKPDDNSYINTVRHKDKKYDEVFKKALSISNDSIRNKMYEQADQIVIDNAPLLPIYYDVDHRLLQPYVMNYPQNAMEYRSMREVWFDYKKTKNTFYE